MLDQLSYASVMVFATVLGHLLGLDAKAGAAGIIMLGWSAAFLVSLLSRLQLQSPDWLGPRSRRSRYG